MAKSKFDLEKYQPLFTPAAIFLGGLAIAAAIFFTGGFSGAPSSTAGVTDPGNSAPEAGSQEVEVSVDDDPVLGDPNAPVTMIEFLDFECPFCNRHFEDTFPQIKEEYIDTGQVKMVVRDLPLSFHDPVATKEALAANCARDQGGDKVYFSYHDEILSRTAANGDGMPEGSFEDIANKVGLNVSEFKSCLSSEKFKNEVEKDLADAESYGSEIGGIGTPTFFIGKSSPSGTFTGKVISGALPFSAFEQVIGELLNE